MLPWCFRGAVELLRRDAKYLKGWWARQGLNLWPLPCQGWGRGFESLRPLQRSSTQSISYTARHCGVMGAVRVGGPIGVPVRESLTEKIRQPKSGSTGLDRSRYPSDYDADSPQRSQDKTAEPSTNFDQRLKTDLLIPSLNHGTATTSCATLRSHHGEDVASLRMRPRL